MPNTFATILAAAATLVLLSSGISGAGEFKARRLQPGSTAVQCDAKRQSPNCSASGNGAELEMINLQSMVSQQQMAAQLASQILSRLNNCDVCGNIR